MPPLLPGDGVAPAASPRGSLFSALEAGATVQNPCDDSARQSAADLRHDRHLPTVRPGGRMAEYTATAVCEGDNWVIDVHGVGTTHAETVGDVEDMAVALVT